MDEYKSKCTELEAQLALVEIGADNTSQKVCSRVHFMKYYMKNLIYHFPTCYAYSVKKPIGAYHSSNKLRTYVIISKLYFNIVFYTYLPEVCIH